MLYLFHVKKIDCVIKKPGAAFFLTMTSSSLSEKPRLLPFSLSISSGRVLFRSPSSSFLLLWSCGYRLVFSALKIKRLLQRLRHECCLRGLVNLLLNLYLIILIVLIRELVFFFLYCDFAYLSESSQNVLPVFVYMKLSMLLCLSRCHYLVTTDIFL